MKKFFIAKNYRDYDVFISEQFTDCIKYIKDKKLSKGEYRTYFDVKSTYLDYFGLIYYVFNWDDDIKAYIILDQDGVVKYGA